MSWQNVFLKAFLRWQVKPLSAQSDDIDKIRNFARRLALKPKTPVGWRVREMLLPPLKGEWIEPDRDAEPEAARTKVVLYFHGGGYFFHSPQSHRPITFALAKESETRVFSLDYRLAPENRFPAALDDAVAAYRRLMMDGIPARNVVVAGDSAGGGLAMATLISLRDQGDPMPAGAVLFSPWTDLAATGDSLRSNDKTDPMFHGADIGLAAQHYLGGMPGTHPLASPLYSKLHDLPPLFVQASRIEVLLDDSLRMVEKARQAGTSVIFKSWPNLPHVWHIYAPYLPEARTAIHDASIFIRSRLG